MTNLTDHCNVKFVPAAPFNLKNQEKISELLIPLLRVASQDEGLRNLADKGLLRHFFWNATAFNNNSVNSVYSGQPYWTENAVRQYIDRASKDFGNRHSGLRHEHAVPIKLLKEKAWENPENIGDIINTFSRAVVVTKEEDDRFKKLQLNDRMPKGFQWSKNQVFMRYELAGVGPILDVRKSAELWEILTCNKRRFSLLIGTFNL